MNTQCPKCGQVFETEESAVGQWVTCPECGGEWCVLTPEEGKSIIKKKSVSAISKKEPREFVYAHLLAHGEKCLPFRRITCPSCKAKYRVDFNHNAGKYFRCEICQADVKISKSDNTFWWNIGVFLKVIFIFGTAGLVFIGIPAWLIYSMYSCAAAPKTEKANPSKKTNIDAWVYTQYLIEEHLKSPKSAKFPFGGAQNHVEESAPGIFIIRSYVDSQNSFGATIRTRFFCKLQDKNGKFEVLQLTFQ